MSKPKTQPKKKTIILITGEPGLGMSYHGFTIGKRGWWKEKNKHE